MNFPDADYAAMRMNRCVFLIEGHASMIVETESSTRGVAQDLRSGDMFSVDYRNKDKSLRKIDYSPVPLGNVNMPGIGASFITRAPARTWRVGFHRDNYINLTNGSNPFANSISLANCIENQYPSIKTAHDYTKDTLAPLAFHRYLSISGGSLVFKTRIVGKIDDKGNWELSKNYSFLQEYIQELMNEV